MPFLLVLSALGCDSRTYQPRTVESPAFDFALEHTVADRWTELQELGIHEYSARRQLLRGWSFPEPNAPHSGKGLWAASARPSVRFWIAETGPRAVSFEVLGADPRSYGAELALNGKRVGEFTVQKSMSSVAFELPEELQHPGLNQLDFEIHGGIRPSTLHAENYDSRFLSGWFSDLQVKLLDPKQARRSEKRARLVPGGSQVVLDGAGLEQASGSVIRYALKLAPKTVFESELVQSGSPESLRFLVRLRDEGGSEELLVDQVLESQELSRLIRVDLDRYRDRVVELEFAVEGAQDPRLPVRGRWGRPVLLAASTESPAPEAAPAGALERARGELASAPVILILLDALNPDYVSTYGGRAGLTPNLDRLAREGKRFDRAFACASYTVSAVGSILTSTPTWKHGAWNTHTRMLDSIETWSERFGRSGYRTAAVVASPNGSSAFGFERGFDKFLEVFRDLPEGQEFAQERDVLAALEKVLAEGDDRPLMLWLHLLEPHEPYGPREPFGTPLDPEYDGSIKADAVTIDAIRSWKLEPTQRDIEHLRALYQDGIAYADHLVGRIRQRLEESGLWQKSVVVLFADHSEALLERRTEEYVGLGHGTSAFNDMTHIPLIVRLPDPIQTGNEPSHANVTNADLLTTVADLVGVPLPEGGTSFAPVLFGADHGERSALVLHSFSLCKDRFMPVFALLDGPYKYVRTSGNKEALYDLSESLFEREDLLESRAVRAALMRQELRRELGGDFESDGLRMTGSQSAQFDESTMHQLKELGYAR